MNFISQFLVSIYKASPSNWAAGEAGLGGGNDIISSAIVLELYLGDNEE